ncbi:uncharacterized protein LOC106643313 [Copidosoma floridanum]|uniref:uncharacterized protein LOC106643313 n=1 Tax=Copidosoma floridanum TaxID=29053 RepID=UPI0006C9DFB6|nr:uncharacterized protein LOC106643313 [Copidosoma floridanum]
MRLILVALSLMLSGGDCRCGERLERALDLMQQRGSSARRRYDNGDDSDVVYREKLRSAPIEVSVTKIQVEASNDYNSVFNSSAFDNDAEDEDVQHDEGVNGEEIDEVAGVIGLANDEENRLGDNADNDAILDNLWRSRGDIAREMEDVFLRSASQAITHYIERQLHPAIKETLMLSMGYTISYG